MSSLVEERGKEILYRVSSKVVYWKERWPLLACNCMMSGGGDYCIEEFPVRESNRKRGGLC